MPLRRCLYILLLLATVPFAATALPQPADTTMVNLRQPSPQQLNKYKQDKAFDYGSRIQSEKTLLQKVIAWLQKKIGQFTDQAPVQYILKILLILCIIGLVLLLVNRLINGNLRSLLKGASAEKPVEVTVHGQQDDHMEWNKLIGQAIGNGDYGLAIHYLYQRSLQQLEQQQYINLKQHKTNHDYLHEISNAKLQGVFRELLRHYQYSEYGGFTVSKEDFKQIQNRFSKMETLLNNLSRG